MNLEHQSFSSSEVASLTGWTTKDIQNMSARGVFLGQFGGGIQGKHFRYSWNNVMEAACGKCLYDIGLNRPVVAINAATQFSHTGHGLKERLGETPSGPNSRRPGFPYHHNLGETILYIAGDHSTVLLDAGYNITRPEISSSLGRPVGYISLNVSEVFRNVCSNLGQHPYEILDEVYPEAAS